MYRMVLDHNNLNERILMLNLHMWRFRLPSNDFSRINYRTIKRPSLVPDTYMLNNK